EDHDLAEWGEGQRVRRPDVLGSELRPAEGGGYPWTRGKHRRAGAWRRQLARRRQVPLAKHQDQTAIVLLEKRSCPEFMIDANSSSKPPWPARPRSAAAISTAGPRRKANRRTKSSTSA